MGLMIIVPQPPTQVILDEDFLNEFFNGNQRNIPNDLVLIAAQAVQMNDVPKRERSCLEKLANSKNICKKTKNMITQVAMKIFASCIASGFFYYTSWKNNYLHVLSLRLTRHLRLLNGRT